MVRLRHRPIVDWIGAALLVVFLGDGAGWVWELARLNFPQAICILDLYHAIEQLNELCRRLYAGREHWIRRMQERWYHQMENDGIAEVIASARRRLSELAQAQPEEIEKQIGYFENNQHRMRYKTYRQQGCFCGSGVVEAGCKTVVGQRLKQSGMLWGRPGAQSVLDLRCALLGNRWDECWSRLHQSDYLQIRAAA